MTCSIFKKRRNYLVAGIAGLATVVQFIGTTPSLIQAAPVAELDAVRL